MANSPPPGMYPNIPFEEYCRWPYINSSLLRAGRRSAAHMAHAMKRPPNDFTSPALRLGSLTHAALLEPLTIAQHYVVMPDFSSDIRRPDGSQYASPKASGTYRKRKEAFVAANAGKEIVSQPEYDRMLGMVEAVTKNPLAMEMLAAGQTELSMVWKDSDTGLICKSRVDLYDAERCLIPDVKTTSSPAPSFNRVIEKRAYHLQAAFYCWGAEMLTGKSHEFSYVVIESDAPFGVMAAYVDPWTLDKGRELFRERLDLLAKCMKTNEWPGYDNPKRWGLPDVPPILTESVST